MNEKEESFSLDKQDILDCKRMDKNSFYCKRISEGKVVNDFSVDYDTFSIEGVALPRNDFKLRADDDMTCYHESWNSFACVLDRTMGHG